MAFAEEYAKEHGKPVDLSKLEYQRRGGRVYADGRNVLVRACHDVFIECQSGANRGILLVVRDNHPAKSYLWPIGGGMSRGVPTEESLRRLTKRECGLDIEDIQFLGVARMFWQTSPTGENKGIDDFAAAYFARGSGELQLDALHKEPRIVTPQEYVGLRGDLHGYVRNGMDASIELINR